MSSKQFRSLAHLSEQLGEERFAALISPIHTARVRDFCDQLLVESKPDEYTIGGRCYEFFKIFRDSDGYQFPSRINGYVKWLRENGGLDQEMGAHLMESQEDIPVALRNRVFVYINWWATPIAQHVGYIFWSQPAEQWTRTTEWKDVGQERTFYVFRIKPE